MTTLKIFKLNFKFGEPSLNGRLYDPVQFREKVLRYRNSLKWFPLYSKPLDIGINNKLNIIGSIKKIKYTSDGCEIGVHIINPYNSLIGDKELPEYFSMSFMGRNVGTSVYHIGELLSFYMIDESV